MKLFLKGERCLTEKCAIERRSYPPGEHGRGRIKQSEYLLQLREKQKARRYYGLLEKQFRSYYSKAAKGVDLREPLKPAPPADSHAITLPSRSVRATIVLLKDVLMCAWPMAMFLRTRRRVRPRAA